MPSLKTLRDRIGSVKSTRKITSAMKMVAAAKLRRAQEQAEAGRPYAQKMARMMSRLAAGVVANPASPRLLVGTGSDQRHLIVVVTSDRGLCGAFNSNVVREARALARDLLAQGKDVKFLCVGRKGRDLLRRDNKGRIVGTIEDVAKPQLNFAAADSIADKVLEMFARLEFDVCTLVYNQFQSVVSQKAVRQQLIPFPVPEARDVEAPAQAKGGAIYEFEPEEEEILAALLPRNISVQFYRGLLESNAGEHAARMTAMDNATRNAGDMIRRLTLTYNRTRQAYITKELIEIISGAEAV